LIKYEGNAVLKPANPIYSKVIIRTLTHELREKLPVAKKINGWTEKESI
jgi:hypothetical protein